MMTKLTPAQERNEVKSTWAAKLRTNGHVITWRLHRGRPGTGAAWIGRCKHCPGSISVEDGGSASTQDLGWTGSKPCPAKKQGGRR